MMAAPIPDNEQQRMNALRSLNLLFTPAEERFDRITRLTSKVFDAPIALVTLVADQSQWFKSATGLGIPATPREVSFCGHAILGEATFVVENAYQDPRFVDNPLVTGESNIGFYAGHPICTEDGSRVGTLCVIDHKPREFSIEQRDTLRDLAALVEAEIGRVQLNESHRALLQERDELQINALVDGQTRLWNRAGIMELLHKEHERARRGVPMCLAMVDVDRFKSINDTCGHLAGDATLAELAKRLRHAVRDFDMVGRFGGDEFVVVLSNCSLDAAMVVAQRIRSCVAGEPIAIPDRSLLATVSIGLAAYDVTHGSAADLIGAADAALYRAKADGRNCIRF